MRTAAALLLFALPSAAQDLRSQQTGNTAGYASGGGAQVTVELRAVLQSAIELTLVGASDDGALTAVDGAGATGTVDFGSFDTLCSHSLRTGQCVPAADGSGAYLVASFEARVRASGAPSADVAISVASATVDAPGGQWVVAAMSAGDAGAAHVRFGGGTETAWDGPSPGTVVPMGRSEEGNLARGLRSGATVPHQVAMFFPTEAAPGAYATLVRWTATTN